MSMCLLRLQLLLFLAIKTLLGLSQYTFNGLDIESTILSPEIKLFNHTPGDVASKQDMNSTSIVEVGVIVCFPLLQDLAPPTNIKMYPDVGFHESIQPTKSESE